MSEAKDFVPDITPMACALVTCLRAHIASYEPSEADIRFAKAMELPDDEMIAILHFINAKSPSVRAQQLASTFIQPCTCGIGMFSSIYAHARNGVKAAAVIGGR